MRAIILTVIKIHAASTAKRFPKRLMVQVQGHVAPLDRACHRLHHSSLNGEANDHSTRTKGSRLVTQTRVKVIMYLLMATKKPIGTAEAAEMFGVLPQTVVRLIRDGEIPGF
jgi:hypothetical protein